jgi:hypothetical protein
MPSIPYEAIQEYRRRIFRTDPSSRLKERDEAVEFINQRGFVLFWPIKGITYPSLWAAVAGDRPVADEHDDPGHVTWGWKDSLLGSRSWYYAKVLRKKATMIAMPVVPYFYALTENYGAPEEDYLTLYEQGRLTQEAKALYEALLQHGPLDTIALRKASRLTSKDSESRFNKALSDLQADFKILPIAVTDAGAWHYAFAYDITTRHYPDLIDQTRFITERQATKRLAELYYRSVGAAPVSDLAKIFSWPLVEARRAVEMLAESGSLVCHVQVENQPGEWVAQREFF